MKNRDKIDKNMKSHVYILECNNGSYYIGSTKNLERRLKEHNDGKVYYTKTRRPLTLKYTEEFDTYKLAFKREKQLKSWKKRAALERLFKNR